MPLSLKGLDIHIVLDNYSTNETGSSRQTALHGFNLVERWFAELTNKQIRRGARCSTPALEDAIKSYLKVNDNNPKPFVWTKTATEIWRASPDFVKDLLTQDTSVRPLIAGKSQ
jgi:hypothetical protein